jgi:tetratricopeptide (TPR) repeat protein
MPGDPSCKGARRGTLLTAIVFAAAPALAGPRVTFTRTVTSAYSLAPGQRVVVISAIGDHASINTFVDFFVDAIDHAGTLRIQNAIASGERDYGRLRRYYPADRYVGISAFTCNGTQRNAVGSERDQYGDRVQRMHMWMDATCEARVDIRNDHGEHLMSMSVRGEGTSPRSSALTDEEKQVAFDQAARYAALNAADMITPRVVKETIELDESAPAFEEGASMIEVNRLQDARAIWEAALQRNRNSAALNFNLAAVCEAAGDVASARKYFQAAVHLAPNESRYRAEMRRAGSRRP